MKTIHINDRWTIPLALGPGMVWRESWELAFSFPNEAELEASQQTTEVTFFFFFNTR